ncbi:NUDIX domain-containing protein [bacterium]|nr:NUDIX domain-containing protein [bacterium]
MGKISGPSFENLFENIEKSYRIYKVVVWFWGLFPQKLKMNILRFFNPSVTLGALAVIIDPYSSPSDPCVLLGWHSYNEKQNMPWALLGGALKKRDKLVNDKNESFIPVQAVVREVYEETGLDIEVAKLLSIDTDWNNGTMDFYFECSLKHGYPKGGVRLKNPEISKIQWFKISELPDNMLTRHKRFLMDVLPSIPKLPGVSWTANQRPPLWWDKFHRAESIKKHILNSSSSSEERLAVLVDKAREILDCELVSLFVATPPIEVISLETRLPKKVEGSLSLLVESHDRRGLLIKHNELIIPISQSNNNKLGLTAWAIQAHPLGEPIRLHEDWLHYHDEVKSWQGHLHLNDRICHSFASVSIINKNRILGIIKAENKKRKDLNSNQLEFIPFAPDDSYILKSISETAASILELL